MGPYRERDDGLTENTKQSKERKTESEDPGVKKGGGCWDSKNKSFDIVDCRVSKQRTPY